MAGGGWDISDATRKKKKSISEDKYMAIPIVRITKQYALCNDQENLRKEIVAGLGEDVIILPECCELLGVVCKEREFFTPHTPSEKKQDG